MDIDATTAIERLGGAERVAELIKDATGHQLSRTAVANWRLANRQIPWRWQPVVEKLLKRKRAA